LIDEIDACLVALKKEGKVATARMVWAAVVSLLIHRGALAVQRQFELKQRVQEKVTPQYIPTQKEFETMLRFALCARDFSNPILRVFYDSLAMGGRGILDAFALSRRRPESTKTSGYLNLLLNLARKVEQDTRGP
jgi:hypothetical protein